MSEMRERRRSGAERTLERVRLAFEFVFGFLTPGICGILDGELGALPKRQVGARRRALESLAARRKKERMGAGSILQANLGPK